MIRLEGDGSQVLASALTMKACFPAALLFLSIALLGCGGVGEYRKTGGTYAARGPNCDYRVIRSGRGTVEPFEELGRIDLDAFSMKQLPNNEDRFRKVVGPTVCAAGGHAVIPAIDIYGHWVHGTIIRFNPAECDRCRTEGVMRETENLMQDAEERMKQEAEGVIGKGG